jgi:hypothetical protein
VVDVEPKGEGQARTIAHLRQATIQGLVQHRSRDLPGRFSQIFAIDEASVGVPKVRHLHSVGRHAAQHECLYLACRKAARIPRVRPALRDEHIAGCIRVHRCRPIRGARTRAVSGTTAGSARNNLYEVAMYVGLTGTCAQVGAERFE